MEFKEKEFSIEAAIAKGRELPEWYLNEPDIYAGDYFYLKAFYELGTCRQIGQTHGPIPWRDIVYYANFQGLDQDMMQPFVDIIREMDSAYIDYHLKRQERLSSRKKRLGNG